VTIRLVRSGATKNFKGFPQTSPFHLYVFLFQVDFNLSHNVFCLRTVLDTRNSLLFESGPHAFEVIAMPFRKKTCLTLYIIRKLTVRLLSVIALISVHVHRILT
jgi:hypothetical protein